VHIFTRSITRGCSKSESNLENQSQSSDISQKLKALGVESINAMDSLFHGGYYDDGYSSDEDDDCWWRNDPRFEVYSRRELEEDILFLRPDYNAETDEFASEGKNISWCIDNGFEEVEDGVWSGPWYWRRRGGEEAREKRLKLNASRRQNIQLQRESYASIN